MRMQFARRDTHAGALRREREAIPNSFPVLHFARRHRAALYAARVVAGAGISVTVGDERGVSDPHLAAPFFAPGPVLRGSLTPHLRVSFVRLHSASSLSCARHSAARARSRALSPCRSQVSPGTYVF